MERLHPVQEITIRYRKTRVRTDVKKIDGPKDVFIMMSDMFRRAIRESMYALYLTNKNELIGRYCLGTGTLSECPVHYRDILQGAILSNAAAFILVHNHPSGVLTPSKEDIRVTEQAVNAAAIMGIMMLDHVIVSDTEYLSMREQGHIKQASLEDAIRYAAEHFSV
jgi:DNA repair protein RadC